MPELPEVETVKRGLAPFLEGHCIAAACAYHSCLRYPIPQNIEKSLLGKKILSIGRRAKYLLFFYLKIPCLLVTSVCLDLGE